MQTKQSSDSEQLGNRHEKLLWMEKLSFKRNEYEEQRSVPVDEQ